MMLKVPSIVEHGQSFLNLSQKSPVLLIENIDFWDLMWSRKILKGTCVGNVYQNHLGEYLQTTYSLPIIDDDILWFLVLYCREEQISICVLKKKTTS